MTRARCSGSQIRKKNQKRERKKEKDEVSKGGIEKGRIKAAGCAAGMFQSVCHGCLELFDSALGLCVCVCILQCQNMTIYDTQILCCHMNLREEICSGEHMCVHDKCYTLHMWSFPPSFCSISRGGGGGSRG